MLPKLGSSIIILLCIMSNLYILAQQDSKEVKSSTDKLSPLSEDKMNFCKGLVDSALVKERDKIKELQNKYKESINLVVKKYYVSRINKCYRQISMKKIKEVFLKIR